MIWLRCCVALRGAVGGWEVSVGCRMLRCRVGMPDGVVLEARNLLLALPYERQSGMDAAPFSLREKLARSAG